MKKCLGLFLIGGMLLTGCSEKKDEQLVDKVADTPPPVEEKNNDAVAPVITEPDVAVTSINTSVFEHAKSVEVTNARDLNKHITLKVDLANTTNPGQGTLNVLTQTFDFLHQNDVVGAETITVFVRVNDIKVSQFKIHTAKFKPNDNDPMAGLVLEASDIEFLTPEVKSYGETFELW